MDFSLDYYKFSLLLGAFSALLAGIIVYIHNRKKLENKTWFLLSLSTAVWSICYFLMIASESSDLALLFNYLLHSAAILIPVFYFFNVLSITNKVDKYKYYLYSYTVFALFLEVVNPTRLFIKDVFPKGPFAFAPDAGPLYILFALFFFGVVTQAIYIVHKSLKETEDSTSKKRYFYVILFTVAAAGGGGSVFLLTFNILIPPYTMFFFSLYPIISAYALFKYQLFEVKVIAAQILTYALWVLLLVQTLLSSTLNDFIVNITVLIVTIILGILLIKSILKEVHAKEKIEQLAKDLEHTNENLTEANARLKELDQLKSEFVSLATHQIRSPLAAIRGYATMILEGDYGKVTAKIKEPLKTVVSSTESLIVIVNDFLDVSRIEQGSMKFDMKDFDMKELVESTVKDLMPNVKAKKLDIDFNYEKGEDYKVYGDYGKIKQIVGNIIDNATKYTPEGWIKVKVERDEEIIRVSIKDSGVGIAKSEIPKLFNKFARAKDANETNVTGTGLGLYVAKNMIEAHDGGKIWVESEGAGKGTTFYIELKAKK